MAIDYLYNGFRIEYWDGNSNEVKGLLGDHSPRSGTDVDFAIAYYNDNDELSLLLIEYKLTESVFTVCGGFSSRNRDKSKHLCEKSFSNIVRNKQLCYYHDIRKNNYWNITEANKSFFANHEHFKSCPFKGGMNQLWRNQILGFAVEDDEKLPYKNVSFLVIYHSKNDVQQDIIKQYQYLNNNNPKFFTFTSKDVIDSAQLVNNPDINKWIERY